MLQLHTSNQSPAICHCGISAMFPSPLLVVQRLNMRFIRKFFSIITQIRVLYFKLFGIMIRGR
jgi:hypothetical protein